eukprot:TRINITY_DN5279_c0_g2_i1.p2 TRINITY_DN5279_c0_g2~~TRINITY_DN5279_c0_g2_i1.p2  ORF type:complete len:313 (+),score=99.03 TRINITY_DN5279_c0_g2_i1:91-1029(+)
MALLAPTFSQWWRRLAGATASVLLLSSAGSEARCPQIMQLLEEERPLMGGPSAPKAINKEVKKVFAEAKANKRLLKHRKKRAEKTGVDFDEDDHEVTLCYYTNQVVAGMNYYVAVSVDDSATYYEIDIYRPLPFMRHYVGTQVMDIREHSLSPTLTSEEAAALTLTRSKQAAAQTPARLKKAGSLLLRRSKKVAALSPPRLKKAAALMLTRSKKAAALPPPRLKKAAALSPTRSKKAAALTKTVQLQQVMSQELRPKKKLVVEEGGYADDYDADASDDDYDADSEEAYDYDDRRLRGSNDVESSSSEAVQMV